MDEQEHVNRQCPYADCLDTVMMSSAATQEGFLWAGWSPAALGSPAVPPVADGTRQYLTAQR